MGTKIRLSENAAIQALTGDVCVRMTHKLTQAQCGLAFASFLTATDRLKKAAEANVPNIPIYDIRSGLQTAESAAGAAHDVLKESPFGKRSKAFSRAAKKLKEEYKTEGTLAPEDIPKLREKVSALNDRCVKLMNDLRDACTVAPTPSIGRRHGKRRR